MALANAPSAGIALLASASSTTGDASQSRYLYGDYDADYNKLPMPYGQFGFSALTRKGTKLDLFWIISCSNDDAHNSVKITGTKKVISTGQWFTVWKPATVANASSCSTEFNAEAGTFPHHRPIKIQILGQ